MFIAKMMYNIDYCRIHQSLFSSMKGHDNDLPIDLSVR
jgi:hypothetical protein